MKSRLIVAAMFAVLLAGMVLVCAVLFNRYQAAISRVATAEEQLSIQSGVIAEQSARMKVLDQLSAEVNQVNRQAAAKSEEKVIEYRTILKTRESCDLAVPDDIAGGLLNYTYRLRAEAMSGTAGGTDTAGASPSATSKLTYCQAVLWIEPLLTAIGQANRQLAALRGLQTERRVTD